MITMKNIPIYTGEDMLFNEYSKNRLLILRTNYFTNML